MATVSDLQDPTALISTTDTSNTDALSTYTASLGKTANQSVSSASTPRFENVLIIISLVIFLCSACMFIIFCINFYKALRLKKFVAVHQEQQQPGKEHKSQKLQIAPTPFSSSSQISVASPSIPSAHEHLDMDLDLDLNLDDHELYHKVDEPLQRTVYIQEELSIPTLPPSEMPQPQIINLPSLPASVVVMTRPQIVNLPSLPASVAPKPRIVNLPSLPATMPTTTAIGSNQIEGTGYVDTMTTVSVLHKQTLVNYHSTNSQKEFWE
eukprot:CAMPEP_0197025556 /NCGR_PEP_ID=MMETSP1384-20130603/5848_1 /TAXON_ID=29189 /ORGANISM="Ammonia sp." /LENGTH=266 /DNA_ID=CAMNT_0042454095 /DNA_START=39 /DNA_END=839 /DNA_ORIENTATION=+